MITPRGRGLRWVRMLSALCVLAPNDLASARLVAQVSGSDAQGLT